MKFLIILCAIGIPYLPIAWVLEASGYNEAKRNRRKRK